MTSPMVSGVLTQAAITTEQSFYWWQIGKTTLLFLAVDKRDSKGFIFSEFSVNDV